MKKEQKAMPKTEKNTYRVKTDGFHGELFLPAEDKKSRHEAVHG